MKKEMKIAMIALLVMLITVATVYLKSEASNYQNWNDYYTKMVNEYGEDIIIGKNGTVHDISGGGTITIPAKQYNDTSPGGDALNKLSILNQPNVWCVEKGKPIGEVTYTINGEWKKIDDHILTYILAHPQYPKSNDEELTLKSTYYTPTQIALWKYLASNYDSAEKDTILSGIGVGSVNISNKDANKLYTNAEKYADAITNIEKDVNINDFTYSYDGAKLIVFPKKEISRLSSFAVTLYNGNTKVGEYSSENNKVSMDVSNIGNNGETIKIEIELCYRTFQAWYKILNNANNSRQRLIVSKFDTQDENVPLEGNITFNKSTYSVSLEKYITKVESAAGNTAVIRRK